MKKLFSPLLALVLGILSALGAGCDSERIKALEEGISTEADVRAQFGSPDTIWPETDGSRTFEYSRQPQGHKNYMITIAPDGKMSALRQVLAPHVFEKIRAQMSEEQIRRLLGRPASRQSFSNSGQTVWEWQWMQAPSDEMLLYVNFDQGGRVLGWSTTPKLRTGR